MILMYDLSVKWLSEILHGVRCAALLLGVRRADNVVIALFVCLLNLSISTVGRLAYAGMQPSR
jgi:hypothetical protein